MISRVVWSILINIKVFYVPDMQVSIGIIVLLHIGHLFSVFWTNVDLVSSNNPELPFSFLDKLANSIYRSAPCLTNINLWRKLLHFIKKYILVHWSSICITTKNSVIFKKTKLNQFEVIIGFYTKYISRFYLKEKKKICTKND